MSAAPDPLPFEEPATGGGDGLPRHIAIIMDGNGRWAARRGLPRVEGHRRGVEALRRTVEAAGRYGIRYLTVYSFSSENWRRPASEIRELFGLLRRFIRRDLVNLREQGVRVRIIGSRVGLERDICDLLTEAEVTTAHNTRLDLIVAFNYGARGEIVDAIRNMAADIQAGRLDPASIDEDVVSHRLSTADIPDPDLVIRTSGEHRLSNFLLWQAAYAELLFVPTLWPDFDDAALGAAIEAYRQRERRFGGLGAGSAG